MNQGYYPYDVGIASKNYAPHLDANTQIPRYKEDEYYQKADKILPHELNQITQALGNVFTNLTEVRNMLSSASRNLDIDPSVIEDMQRKIDKINIILLDIPNDLDKIGL